MKDKLFGGLGTKDIHQGLELGERIWSGSNRTEIVVRRAPLGYRIKNVNVFVSQE